MTKLKVTTYIGYITAITQLLILSIALYIMYSTKMFPIYAIVLLEIANISLVIICISLQRIKKPVFHIINIGINLFMILCAIYGIHMLLALNHALDNVQPPKETTKNMLVVVRVDDPAINLQQLSEYRIGIQETAGRTETETVIENIKKQTGAGELSILQYNTIQAQAQALLENNADAIIYADTFTEVLKESIPGYENQIKILDQNEVTTTEETPVANTRDVTKPFHIYISGIDTDGSISKASRSDVNIIMSIDPKNHKVLLTSTPRDYYVPIPEISGGNPDKLTHAGLYGIQSSIKTLEQLYGIQIDGYVRVNFTSLIKMVDTLGGVTVNSDYAFSAGGYQFQKGANEMNGKKALAFSRERKSFEDGDRQRGKNQQAVITAMIEKASSPSILLNANTLLQNISDSVQTDLSKEELTTLIQLQLKEAKGWHIQSQSANGTGEMKPCFSYGTQPLSVLIPDETTVQTASENMRAIVGH